MAVFFAATQRSVWPDTYAPPARYPFPTLKAAATFAKREAGTPTAICSRVYDRKGRVVKTYTVERPKKRRLKRR